MSSSRAKGLNSIRSPACHNGLYRSTGNSLSIWLELPTFISNQKFRNDQVSVFWFVANVPRIQNVIIFTIYRNTRAKRNNASPSTENANHKYISSCSPYRRFCSPWLGVAASRQPTKLELSVMLVVLTQELVVWAGCVLVWRNETPHPPRYSVHTSCHQYNISTNL